MKIPFIKGSNLLIVLIAIINVPVKRICMFISKISMVIKDPTMANLVMNVGNVVMLPNTEDFLNNIFAAFMKLQSRYV